MDFDLPTKFDLIVVGTGIVESMISAAASRIGKTVLHLDTKDYYGGAWASFSLEGIRKLTKDESNIYDIGLDGITISENENVISVGNDNFNFKHIAQKWHIPKKSPVIEIKPEIEETAEDVSGACGDVQVDKIIEDTQWTQEKLLMLSRKFNIDISPKIQFARGDFVELLISSNIARYSEYRSVSRVLTYLNGQLEIVPCSRSDVFSNAKVTVIEKRMLMKLLTACMDMEEKEFKGYENKPFYCYLKDKKLTENVIYYVLYAIAMCTIDTPCMTGVQSVRRFVSSLGRFGKTPFLYSMYGSGELSQAFCRLSAVFGGVYALNQQLNGVILDNEKLFKGIICGAQKINAEHLVIGVDRSPREFVENVTGSYISRAIFIVDKSIMQSEKEHLTLLLFPTQDGKRLSYIMEFGCLTGTCCKDIYVVHMFTKQEADPKQDLEHCVTKLFKEVDAQSEQDNRPEILWSFYYATPDTNNVDLTNGVPSNVFVCPGPDLDLDIDVSIKKAKEIFDKMYPECEFLPRAPDPEELIIGDEEDDETTENKTTEDQDTKTTEEQNTETSEEQNIKTIDDEKVQKETDTTKEETTKLD